MSVAVGAWIVLAGVVAALPALGAVSRRRRVSVQFALDDGRIVERPCPRPARKSFALIPGEKVHGVRGSRHRAGDLSLTQCARHRPSPATGRRTYADLTLRALEGTGPAARLPLS